MRGRLTVGQLPLEQFILVRIQAPQQIPLDKIKIFVLINLKYNFKLFFMDNFIPKVYAQVTINPGITPPSLSDILAFIIRGFFILAGLAAILYLLWGAFNWITSGGSKENVEKAREKIQAAVLGLIIIFIVLSLVVLVENIFNFGLGISKDMTIPTLVITGVSGGGD